MSNAETNLLSLENPQEYSCHLEYYVIGHSEACVRIWRNTGDERFDVKFYYVNGISGRISWSDATLRLGTEEDHHQFVRQMMPVDGKSDEELSDERYGQLYIFEGNGVPVRILALAFEKKLVPIYSPVS